MKIWKLLAAALAAGAVGLCGPAGAADNYAVKDATGATKTICSKDASGVHATCHVSVNADGITKINPATSDLQGTTNTKLDTLHTDIGTQGTGAAYNPPTGGSGPIGYLSGVLRALLGNSSAGTAAESSPTANLGVTAYNKCYNGATWDPCSTATTQAVTQSGGPWTVTSNETPTASATYAIAPSLGASSSVTSLIAKASAGNVYGFRCVSATASAKCILYDNATVPSAGALTASKVMDCYDVATTSSAVQYLVPRAAAAGAVVLFSTGADCLTYTASSTAYINAAVK
jgi:hypothetical protein